MQAVLTPDTLTQEAEFHVHYAEIGSVGRGTVTEAAKAPTS